MSGPIADEKRGLGVRNLLRKLRGVAPRPVSPEDSLEALFSSNPESGGHDEAEQAPKKAAPVQGNSLGGRAPKSPFG